MKFQSLPCWAMTFIGLKGVDIRHNFHQINPSEKVYFRSQVLEHPSIGEYGNISGVPVLPENVIFTFFKTCWCYSEAYNTGMENGLVLFNTRVPACGIWRYAFSTHLWQVNTYLKPSTCCQNFLLLVEIWFGRKITWIANVKAAEKTSTELKYFPWDFQFNMTGN